MHERIPFEQRLGPCLGLRYDLLGSPSLRGFMGLKSALRGVGPEDRALRGSELDPKGCEAF